jgi:CheY-like chemotaxis protein
MDRSEPPDVALDSHGPPFALDGLGLPRSHPATVWVGPGQALGHVLVVMEDLFLRRLFRQQIEYLGWTVREASSLGRALDRASAVAPQLIVLDSWIEHGTGLRFLEQLRARRNADPIPVLLVGGESRFGRHLRARSLGVIGEVPLHQVAEADAWIRPVLTLASQPPQPA